MKTLDARATGSGGVDLHASIWTPDREPGARPYLLLHGIASTGRSWNQVAPLLAEAGHFVHALDFRGHGLSGEPDDGYDLATFAADVAAAAAALGLVRPIVAGHSLGASVLLRAAAAGLLDASGFVFVEGGLVGAAAQYASFEECVAKMALPPVAGMPLPTLKGFLRQQNPSWNEERMEATLSCFDVSPQGTVSWRIAGPRYEALLRALWGHDVDADWRALEGSSVAALFVATETADPALTEAKRAAAGRLAAAIPRARIERFAGEHDVHMEQPARIAELLLSMAG